uniref:Uncharacterized protein n=1 Tax=Acrobeloides nanus TaxID=290746 RepID=A0A914CB72_9BILA
MGFLISGSHLNPSISLVFWVIGELNWKELILYSIAQTLGSFFGAALTFAVYYDAINDFDGGIRQVSGGLGTAAIFATFPKPYLSVIGGCIDLITSTCVLVVIVFAVIDERNGIPKYAQPTVLGIGLLVTVLSFSMNSGASLNPARDFGPRLFLLCAGYGWEVFRQAYN